MPSDWLNDWENKLQSAQFDLFEKPAPPAPQRPVDDRPLWKHQKGAIEAAIPALQNRRKALVVMATGTGKSRVFNEIISAIDKPTLVLAHRDNLIDQAVANVEQDTDYSVGIEKAWRFGRKEDVIVASIQTICKRDRLNRFDPNRFGLVVVDESHHYIAPSYKRVLDYFESAMLLGVTATPDRSDERKIGTIFGPPVYNYETLDAIKDGVLCDIVCYRSTVAGLDLSTVKSSNGDFNQEDLDLAFKVEGVLQGVADTTLREAGDRRTIVFSTSIANAERLAEIMNRHRPKCAMVIHSKLDEFEVKCRLKQHANGEYQFLVNVGIATEGYDDRQVSCIVLARPTKSRPLCAQMVGRGLRSYTGKANCLVIDFTGNLGIRHRLCTPIDIVGSQEEEDVVALAEELIGKKPEKKVTEAISEAKDLIARDKERELAIASRLGVTAKAIYTKSKVDPFAVLNFGEAADRQVALDRRFGGSVPTVGQMEALKKFGVPLTKAITEKSAGQLIGKLKERSDKGLARYKQVALLRKYGIDAENYTFEVASKSIDVIVKNGWSLPPWEKARIIREARQ